MATTSNSGASPRMNDTEVVVSGVVVMAADIQCGTEKGLGRFAGIHHVDQTGGYR